MSNLTDLLPAGGGGKNVNFVASGTITSGKPVILNSAGTVTEVSGSSVLNGTASNFLSANGAYSAAAYDTTRNQGLVVYRDNNAAIKGRIITVDSSNNITYGTETTIHTASNTADTTAVYDSTHQRYVVMFKDNNSYGQARTLSPSGTGGSATFTVGNATYFPVSASNNIRATFLDSCFDPDTGQVIVAFADTSNSNHFYMSVGEVRTSPEDIQWGTAVAVDTGGACSSFSVTYDTTANRVLALWELDGTSGKAVVGTVTSGTIGSFGSVVNYTSNPYRPGAAYNVDNNCFLILFRNDAGSNYLNAIGAKVDGSGNSVVFGTAVVITSEYSESYPQGVTYSTAIDKFTAAYYLASGYQYRNFNVSSAATPVVTLDAAVTFPSPSDGLYANYYDPDEDAVVFTWRGVGGPWVAQAITPGSTNLSATSFIGIADADIANAASGSITIKGGISTIKGGTYAVTVVNSGSGNKYAINGVEQSVLNLYEGATYKFDQSSGTNAGHPFRFSTTADGTHGGGSEYTTGVTTSGVPGNAGAYTQIIVASGAPTLYYYCSVHSGMGGTANTLAIAPNSNYYVQNDGTLTTTTSTVLAGRALSSTSINLDYTT